MSGEGRSDGDGDGDGVSTSQGAHVVVVGGGLAGITAALDAADAGARVTLLERRRRLGGLTYSFEHDGRQIDNGQHVFLRCCTAYLGFLERIGSAGDVTLQPRLDITALRPGALGDGPRVGRLRRNALPAPFHLAIALARYRQLPFGDRLRIGLAALPLRRLDLDDPALDTETFAGWLGRHGQRPEAIEALWDLITVATINLRATEASLAMGAKVFKTGLLTDAASADIGWSQVPLGRLHGERAAVALAKAGVAVRLDARVTALVRQEPGWEVRTAQETVPADAVIMALPHTEARAVLPADSVAHQDRLDELGTSAIVNVHVLYDRPVTDLPIAAGLGTTVQWVFDRTVSSGARLTPGAGRGQYLVASLSAADDLLGRRPDDLATEIVGELERLFPAARQAAVVDTLVTKERTATFRAAPRRAGLRAPAPSRLPGLALAGAWTDTGWPATMEGAVRSGHAAAATLAGRHSGPTEAVADRPVKEEVA